MDENDLLSTPSGYATPFQVQAAREYAMALLQGKGHGPVQSPQQGIGEVVRALAGGRELGAAGKQDRASDLQDAKAMAYGGQPSQKQALNAEGGAPGGMPPDAAGAPAGEPNPMVAALSKGAVSPNVPGPPGMPRPVVPGGGDANTLTPEQRINPTTAPHRLQVPGENFVQIMASHRLSPAAQAAAMEHYYTQNQPVVAETTGGKISIAPDGTQRWIGNQEKLKEQIRDIHREKIFDRRPDGSLIEAPQIESTPGGAAPGGAPGAAPVPPPTGPQGGAAPAGAPGAITPSPIDLNPKEPMDFTGAGKGAPAPAPAPGKPAPAPAPVPAPKAEGTPAKAAEAPGTVMSDASPDPVVPGAQYASLGGPDAPGAPTAAPGGPAAKPTGGMLGVPPPSVTGEGSKAEPIGGPQTARIRPQDEADLRQLDQIDLDKKREEEFTKGSLKHFDEEYKKMMESGRVASEGRSQIALARQLIEDPTFIQGSLAEPRLALARFLDLIDKSPHRAAANEAFEKIISGNILSEMKISLQGLGQVRVAEIELLARAAANKNNTLPANRAVLEMMLRSYDRAAKISEMANAYYDGYRYVDNGKGQFVPQKMFNKSTGLDANFIALRDKYVQANPIIRPGEQKQIEKIFSENEKFAPLDRMKYLANKKALSEGLTVVGSPNDSAITGGADNAGGAGGGSAPPGLIRNRK